MVAGDHFYQYACLVARFNSLDSLLPGLRDADLRAAIEGLHADLEQGTGFEEALGRFPKQFPPGVVAWFALGERTGRLEDLEEQVLACLCLTGDTDPAADPLRFYFTLLPLLLGGTPPEEAL